MDRAAQLAASYGVEIVPGPGSPGARKNRLTGRKPHQETPK